MSQIFWIYLVDLPPFIIRETSCLLFWTPSTFLKGVYSKRKEFALKGANSFLLEKTPFQNGDNHFDSIISRLPAIYYKGDFLFAFLNTNPLLKRGLLSREQILSF